MNIFDELHLLKLFVIINHMDYYLIDKKFYSNNSETYSL